MLEEFDKKLDEEAKNTKKAITKMFLGTQSATREANKVNKPKKLYTEVNEPVYNYSSPLNLDQLNQIFKKDNKVNKQHDKKDDKYFNYSKITHELETDQTFECDLDNDIPEEIIGNKFEKGEFNVLIKWKNRSDGIIPKPSYVTSSYLKTRFPTILIDFYISKIKLK